jgi:phosphoadenosine phosphosulfate reductase
MTISLAQTTSQAATQITSQIENIDVATIQLDELPAERRIEWAIEHLPGNHVVSSSFGIHSAVMLHMMTRIRPDIPVIVIDTGYLFDETYGFMEKLTGSFNLNLQVFKPKYTPRELEEKFGKLWLKGEQGLEIYNQITKIEPMARALDQTGARTWLAGLRSQQSQSRHNLKPLQIQDGRYKVHPIVEWNNREVHFYLKKHNIPYHPLWHDGYVSVGDIHTTKPLSIGMKEEETRFFGIQRECGIHQTG